MCHIGRKLFLFGGESSLAHVRQLGLFHAFDLETAEWGLMENVRAGCNRQGSLRARHSACTCGPLVSLIGGRLIGHCESHSRKVEHGVRLLDSRDLLPAYPEAMCARSTHT